MWYILAQNTKLLIPFICRMTSNNLKFLSYEVYCLLWSRGCSLAENYRGFRGTSTVKIDATSSSETSTNSQLNTRHHIPVDNILHTHFRDNLKSHNFLCDRTRTVMFISIHIISSISRGNFFNITISEIRISLKFDGAY